VRLFLGFLGITDVEFIYAEGLAISAESREKALAGARAAIGGLAAPLPIARVRSAGGSLTEGAAGPT